MIDSKKQAELDQALTQHSEFFPSLWRGLFLGCVRQGFSKPEAFDLLKTYILSSGSKG